MPPSIVYHYCSLETFFNIISNSTIRMSNISKSNDSEELTYILSKYRYWLSQWLNPYNDRLADAYKLRDNFVDNAFDYRLNELSTTFYISCFSEKNDLLSQWRGYANDACGVSIGISTDTFNSLFSSTKEYYNFAKVKYENGDLDLLILDYIHKKLTKNGVAIRNKILFYL